PVGQVNASTHVRDAMRGEHLPQLFAVAIAPENKPVYTSANEIARLFEFDVGIVTARGQEQQVAGRHEVFLQGFDTPREHRVVDGRDDCAEGSGALGRQRACRSLRDIAELLDRGLDAGPHLRANGLGLVERTRYGRNRDHGMARYGANSPAVALALGHWLTG